MIWKNINIISQKFGKSLLHGFMFQIMQWFLQWVVTHGLDENISSQMKSHCTLKIFFLVEKTQFDPLHSDRVNCYLFCLPIEGKTTQNMVKILKYVKMGIFGEGDLLTRKCPIRHTWWKLHLEKYSKLGLLAESDFFRQRSRLLLAFHERC